MVLLHVAPHRVPEGSLGRADRNRYGPWDQDLKGGAQAARHRLEADSGAGGDVEPAAAGGGPVEGEGEVGFGEVEVAADLDGVGDLERDRLAPVQTSNSPLWSGARGEVNAPEAARLVSV